MKLAAEPGLRVATILDLEREMAELRALRRAVSEAATFNFENRREPCAHLKGRAGLIAVSIGADVFVGDAIALVVRGYVPLNNREALEDPRTHRQSPLWIKSFDEGFRLSSHKLGRCAIGTRECYEV
jgi:hypothetical protein